MNRDDAILQQLSHARYAEKPFPPYRYLPGVNPHPTASPQGHSFRLPGTPTPHSASRPPEQWRQCGEYLHGCDLYNHAYWWEAHEEWEGFWHTCPKDSAQRRFLQGLIQVSACHLKLHLGHLDGVARLRDSSHKHLYDAVAMIDGDDFMGLHVARFLDALSNYYDAILASTAPHHEPTRFPYISLNNAGA